MPTERPMPRWTDDADRFGQKSGNNSLLQDWSCPHPERVVLWTFRCLCVGKIKHQETLPRVPTERWNSTVVKGCGPWAKIQYLPIPRPPGAYRSLSKPVRMKPGSIVRCVDDTHWREHAYKDFPTLPIREGLYTVRRIIPNIVLPNGPPGVALEEIRGAWAIFATYRGDTVYEEYHFRMNRFVEILPPIRLQEFLEAFMNEYNKIKAWSNSKCLNKQPSVTGWWNESLRRSGSIGYQRRIRQRISIRSLFELRFPDRERKRNPAHGSQAVAISKGFPICTETIVELIIKK